MDLVLVLDGSGSIDPEAWLDIMRFSAGIGLNFTTGSGFMQYGVVQFASEASVYMPMQPNNATFMQTLATMKQLQSGTNTSGAMAVARQEFDERGRHGAFKVVIVITDGMWNTGGSPLPIAEEMKRNGTHIFTVAVGNADVSNVKNLSSTPLDKYYYNVSTESELPTILHSMIWSICRRG